MTGRSAMRGVRRFLGSALCVASLSLCLAGCATWQAPGDFDDAGLRARAVTASRQDVRISAAVLSAEDSRRMFGADVDQLGVQSVWVEVQNQTPERLWLLRSGTDPDYFSPLEVAWSLHSLLAGEANARIDDHFDRLGFQNPILPGETRAGVLFVNPERRTRLLNLDLLQPKRLIPFSLFLPVPDSAGDPRSEPVPFSYSDAESINFKDLSAIRASLERLPCCASDSRGRGSGDPLNAVFVGELSDIAAALVRRSYRRDTQPGDDFQQVFGRGPDAVLRKIAQAGAPSTWIRLWLAPIRFEGRHVFLGQIGRPVGGRFVARGAADVILHEDVGQARRARANCEQCHRGREKPTAPRCRLGDHHEFRIARLSVSDGNFSNTSAIPGPPWYQDARSSGGLSYCSSPEYVGARTDVIGVRQVAKLFYCNMMRFYEPRWHRRCPYVRRRCQTVPTGPTL